MKLLPATLQRVVLDTPLGSVLAIADEVSLHFLEFIDSRDYERKLANLQKMANIDTGITKVTSLLKSELASYFAGNLQEFTTPIKLLGTPFQIQVWQALTRIPYGKTKSYSEQAMAVDKPTAFRAVANANGANCLAIIVPCHRVVRSCGDLGGYGGGIARKEWLLKHEDRFKSEIC